MRKKVLYLGILLLMLVPLISAYSNWDFSSPKNLLDNEWFMFGAIFLGIFVLIYFAGLKTFESNKGILSIIAGVISLFSTSALMKKDMYYNFLGPDLGQIIVIVLLILSALVILWAIIKKTGFLRGLISGLILLFLISYFTIDYLPDDIKYGPIGDFLVSINELGTSFIWGIIIGAILILVWLILKKSGKKVGKVGWNYGKNKYINLRNSKQQKQQQQAAQQKQQAEERAIILRNKKKIEEQLKQAIKNYNGNETEEGAKLIKELKRQLSKFRE